MKEIWSLLACLQDGGTAEGAGKARWRIWGLREPSLLPAVSSVSLPCAPGQLLRLLAGQSHFRPCMQAFSSQDTALAGLSPLLCSEPQFCLHWSWALSPLSSASGLLSGTSKVPFLQDPHPHPSQRCHPLKLASAGGRSLFPCGLHTQSKQLLGTSHSCSAGSPRAPPPPPTLLKHTLCDQGWGSHPQLALLTSWAR